MIITVVPGHCVLVYIDCLPIVIITVIPGHYVLVYIDCLPIVIITVVPGHYVLVYIDCHYGLLCVGLCESPVKYQSHGFM